MMTLRRNRVEVLHGVNFDVLDQRDADTYGGLSLAQLEQGIEVAAHELDLLPRFFQTNSESEFVEYLHRLYAVSDGIVINAGAWTHYSYAIRDALDLTGLPAVEVHLSAVENREEFRRVSVFDGLTIGKVSGQGPDGYREALRILVDELRKGQGGGANE